MRHRRMFTGLAGVWLASLALVTVTAHSTPKSPQPRGWWQLRAGAEAIRRAQEQGGSSITSSKPGQLAVRPIRDLLEGERLFDRETFGGNGRTCLTCHSRETGTVSPGDARALFRRNP